MATERTDAPADDLVADLMKISRLGYQRWEQETMLKAADRIRSLEAQRDEAVGLLRRWLPQGGRFDAAIDTRALLDSLKEGR